MKPLNALPLLQNLYTGVIWVGADLRINWVNTQSEQLLSVSQSRLIGLNILDILLPCKVKSSQVNKKSNSEKQTVESSEKSINKWRKKLKTQFNNAKEYQQPFIEYSRHIRGVTLPLYIHYSVTPIEQDQNIHFLIEIWEGDRQNRLDKEHRLQKQHDVSREMLRSVAHEVKNPLAGIRGAAQLLIKQTQVKRDTSNTDNGSSQINLQSRNQSDKFDNNDTMLVDAKKLKTYANIVISETDRLTKLIEQLLGSNQLPEFHSINIHEPLEHVLVLTQTQHPEVLIERDYDLSLPELMADKNQLIQVFLNLANNACEAMLEQDPSLLVANYQPKLTLTTRIEHQYTIGTVHHRHVIRVTMRDNGAGISEDLIERIFFPLVTGRASGTGLGLALVQEIVQRHEGAIEVNSQSGETEFSIYLPLNIKESTHPNTHSKAQTKAHTELNNLTKSNPKS